MSFFPSSDWSNGVKICVHAYCKVFAFAFFKKIFIVLYSFLGGKKHKQKSNLVQMGKLRLLSTWLLVVWALPLYTVWPLSLGVHCTVWPISLSVYSMTSNSLYSMTSPSVCAVWAWAVSWARAWAACTSAQEGTQQRLKREWQQCRHCISFWYWAHENNVVVVLVLFKSSRGCTCSS